MARATQEGLLKYRFGETTEMLESAQHESLLTSDESSHFAPSKELYVGQIVTSVPCFVPRKVRR